MHSNARCGYCGHLLEGDLAGHVAGCPGLDKDNLNLLGRFTYGFVKGLQRLELRDRTPDLSEKLGWLSALTTFLGPRQRQQWEEGILLGQTLQPCSPDEPSFKRMGWWWAFNQLRKPAVKTA